MSSVQRYIVGDCELSSFHEYRDALADFLRRPDAAQALENNAPMRAALLYVYHHHYHWDPDSGRPPAPDDVETVIVTSHPRWGSPCFAIVETDGSKVSTFAVKKLKAEPVSAWHGASGVASGQRRRNTYEALRSAVESTLRQWAEENPPPRLCPVLGLPLSPIWVCEDPVRRYEDTAPTIDHFAPTFRARVAEFLEMEMLSIDTVELKKNAEWSVWELADSDLRDRWVTFHGTEGLRWVSLKANATLNRVEQRSRWIVQQLP